MIEQDEDERAEFYMNFRLDDPGDGGGCLYCGADKQAILEGRHAQDCPFTTGYWPIAMDGGAVREFACDGCGEHHEVRFACPRCRRFFEDEDLYRFANVETGLLAVLVEHPGMGVAICVDCAQKQADALRERMG